MNSNLNPQASIAGALVIICVFGVLFTILITKGLIPFLTKRRTKISADTLTVIIRTKQKINVVKDPKFDKYSDPAQITFPVDEPVVLFLSTPPKPQLQEKINPGEIVKFDCHVRVSRFFNELWVKEIYANVDVNSDGKNVTFTFKPNNSL